MMRSHAADAVREYGRGAASGVEEASPHRLIQVLMTSALARIATARGQMERGEVAAKGRNIGLAISIIDALRASLDPEAGGEIALNLERLYEYMTARLLEANLRNDRDALGEVHRLLGEIKEAWDAIPERLEERPDGRVQRAAGGM